MDRIARGYEAIGPTLIVEIKGQAVDKPALDLRLRSPEPDIRETAWRAWSAAWLARRTEVNMLFLELLDGRRRLAQAAGLSDYRAYRWLQTGRVDYTPADSIAFQEAVASDVVPMASRLCEARRKALGVATLRPWDLLVDPITASPEPAFAGPAAFEAGMARVLAALDPELGTLFTQMGTAGCLDIGWLPGKRGGGVERPYPRTGIPFVRVGEAGTQRGVGTLLHEMGHAFHDHLTMRHHDSVWSLEHPDEFSEVAAYALYLQAAPLLGRPDVAVGSEQRAERALTAFLEETMMSALPSFTLTDAFQHWVFAEAPDGVHGTDIDRKWEELSARFTPWVDWSGSEVECGAGWQREWSPFLQPFNDGTYAVALVGALEVWRGAQTYPGEAWNSYRTALAQGSTQPLRTLFASAGASWPFTQEAVHGAVTIVDAGMRRAMT